MRKSFLIALTAIGSSAALFAACTANPTAPAISTTLGDVKTLSFTMNKWTGPDSDPASVKTPVSGTFKEFSIYLSKNRADIKKPADLSGLSAKIEVPLGDTNVETKESVRNVRISELYFDAAKYAKATFTFSKFAADSTAEAFPATGVDVTADGELDLHGIKKPFSGVKLKVAGVDGGLQIQTAQDLSIASADFGLGAAALLEACGHKGIDPAATVSFDVVVK